MQVEIEEISSTKKKLRVEISGEEVASEMEAAYREINRTAKIPGFRPGKVPRTILKKHFGREVESSLIEKLVPRSYLQALKEHDLTPVSEPEFDGSVTVKESEPLTFGFTVEIRPRVEPLVYEGLELAAHETEPTAEEFDRALKSIRNSRAVLEPADAAADEDRVAIDYRVFENDAEIEDAGDTDFIFVVGMESLPAEFSEAVRGKKVDDQLDFTVTFPEHHPGQSVAGKTVQVKGVVKEIKRAALPDLDDEFAKEQGFESRDELEKRVRENVAGMKHKHVRRIQMAEAAERLLDANSFDLPEGMLDREIQILTEEAKAADNGGEKKEPADVDHEGIRARAERNVRGFILMDIVAEKENVEVNDDDLTRRLAEISIESGIPPEELIKYYSAQKGALDKLRSGVLQDKVLGVLVDKAKLVEHKKTEKKEAGA